MTLVRTGPGTHGAAGRDLAGEPRPGGSRRSDGAPRVAPSPPREESSCSGPAAALPRQDTDGARQTRAEPAVSPGPRGPGAPSSAARARPGSSDRRPSRQRRHSFGSVAAVLASSLSLPADGRAGYDPCVPRGCSGRAALPPGRCGAGAAGRGSAPAQAAFPAHSGHLAEFRRYSQEFEGRDKRFEGRDPQRGPGHGLRPSAA